MHNVLVLSKEKKEKEEETYGLCAAQYLYETSRAFFRQNTVFLSFSLFFSFLYIMYYHAPKLAFM